MAVHLLLLVWLSPAFPIGAFAYSHGIEWALEAGDITDSQSLEAWIGDLLEHGAGRNDVILFTEAYRACTAGDDARLVAVAELALALATSAERQLEAITQGNAFVLAIANAWPCGAIDRLRAVWPGAVTYPIAVAVAAAGHGLPLADALQAFTLGFVANLVSASVRLGIIGQTDGQRIIAALIPHVEMLARSALESSLDDLGGAAFRSDLAALKHETQYSRLFRS